MLYVNVYTILLYVSTLLLFYQNAGANNNSKKVKYLPQQNSEKLKTPSNKFQSLLQTLKRSCLYTNWSELCINFSDCFWQCGYSIVWTFVTRTGVSVWSIFNVVCSLLCHAFVDGNAKEIRWCLESKMGFVHCIHIVVIGIICVSDFSDASCKHSLFVIVIIIINYFQRIYLKECK